MTSLQGYVHATFEQLSALFPVDTQGSADDKVSTEFIVESPNGTIYLYDWKEYDGGYACRSPRGYNWHVGGRSSSDVEFVRSLLQ
jgi:hypothetical protein